MLKRSPEAAMLKLNYRTLTLALALVSVPSLAQSSDQLFTATHQQLDVTKVILKQEADWNRADLDAYLAHFKDAPDTTAILAAPVRGLANIRSAYRINYPRPEVMGHLDQSEVEVRALGDGFALATGRYHLTRSRKAGGDADGTFTELFEKTSAGWQVIYIQTS